MHKEPNDNEKQYPEGHFMSIGMAVGLPIGIAIGAAMGNVAFGPAIGVALGVGIGAAFEAKAKKEGKIRELTPEERQKLRKRQWIAVVVAALVAVGVVLAYNLVM